MDLKKEPDKKETAKTWSAFSLAWELGFLIAIPIVLLALVGRVLDKNLNTAPIFLLLGIFLSIIITTYLVYRKTAKIMDDEAGEEGDK